MKPGREQFPDGSEGMDEILLPEPLPPSQKSGNFQIWECAPDKLDDSRRR